ncbi:MAG: ATP-binding protein, partial [Caulobacteraceae bacterium]
MAATPRRRAEERRSAPRRTVRGKLIFLVAASVGVAVALVSGVSAWREAGRDAASQVERLRATATVMGSMSAEAAATGDQARGFRTLRAISHMPGVFYARIERLGGTPLVQTGGGARLVGDLNLSADAHSQPGVMAQLRSRTVQVSAPILYNGRAVGRLVLICRTEGVLDRLLGSLGISLVAALFALGVGFAVAWRMQQGITDPIVALTRSMEEIQRGGRYDRTVEADADDEIGDLIHGFNRMLGEIRVRDASIAEHMVGLEGEVAARTVDLRAAKDAAESANRAKSDFLATMSHEIRTPMNGIMVMAEMLAAGEMPPRQRRFAEVIAKSGSSLLAVINDILDFSKIEAGKLELDSVPVDLAEVVEDVCALFWERASSKGLDLAAYIDPAAPARVIADPVRLRQVVGNLVNNAIKFTDIGGVLVEIEPDETEGVCISVHDTGVGIPKDKIGEVFGAFSQADQSTTRKAGGTGLGLAICKRLVDAMGGRFLVNTEVGRGSTFVFRLPVTVLAPAAPWPEAPRSGARVHLAVQGLSSR